MAESDDVKRILEQILETEREHLEEYRKVSKRFSEMQEEGLRRARQQQRLYRWVVAFTSVAIVAILFWIFSR